MAADDALDGFGGVVQQVPGVGHLLGLRCTRAGAVAEGAGAVAADDPHLRVVVQPGGEGVRGAVGEDVDRPVGIHVDEDCRVGAAAAYGELVHAQMRDEARRRDGQCADETEQGVPARGHGQASGDPGSGPSAQEEGYVGELGGEGGRAARVPGRQILDLLSERPPSAQVVPADETTRLQFQLHSPTCYRAVRETPPVVAVQPRRSPPAPRAGGRGRRRPQGETNLAIPEDYLLDLHADTREEKVSHSRRIHHVQVMPTTRSWSARTPQLATEPRT